MIISSSSSSQRGAALAVGLIMLLTLTLIGMASMQSSIMQEKMTGNSRDLGIAFQSGEHALRVGERWLRDTTIKPSEVTTCTSPCDIDDVVWSDGSINDNNLKNVSDWWGTSNTQARTSTTTPQGVSNPPKYIIEFKAFSRDSFTLGTGPVTGRSVYDITTRGSGSTDTSQAIIRSRYARRY